MRWLGKFLLCKALMIFSPAQSRLGKHNINIIPNSKYFVFQASLLPVIVLQLQAHSSLQWPVVGSMSPRLSREPLLASRGPR